MTTVADARTDVGGRTRLDGPVGTVISDGHGRVGAQTCCAARCACRRRACGRVREDVGRLGGVFRITDGLQEHFGETGASICRSPKSAIVGTAVGMAMNGLVPVVELQFDAFAVSSVPTDRQPRRDADAAPRRVSLPMTIRVPYGGHLGAPEHHSESPVTESAGPWA